MTNEQTVNNMEFASEMPGDRPLRFIPETGFKSSMEGSITEKRRVRIKNHGLFEFSHFSLMQFFQGYEHSLLTSKEELVNKEEVILYMIITTSFFVHKNEKIALDRAQIAILLKWLEARIAHCKFEKEQNISKFNPETYIAQRELRLELSSWLAGEVIEDFFPAA